jgi:hypothetical protein
VTKPVTYNPLPGTDIADACRVAVHLAGAEGRPVAFRFNGVDMLASPGESPWTVAGRWHDETERRAEAYRSSPEGQRAAAEAEGRRRHAQRRTDNLMARLPGVTRDLGALVRWCVELSRAADHVGVQWGRDAAVAAIEAAGYREDAHVGRHPRGFADRQVMGEYLVGQSLSCMRKGMPPHPIIDKFAREGGFIRPTQTDG